MRLVYSSQDFRDDCIATKNGMNRLEHTVLNLYIYIPCIYGPVFIEYYDIRSHHMQIFSEYVNNNSYNVYHYPILYFLFSMVSYSFIYSIYIGIRLFRLHFDITLNNKSSNSTIWNVTILDNKRFIRIFNKS